MLDGVLLLWFLLTLGCVVFVIWDQATNTPSVGVMKLAWVLVILYTGPIGLFVYLLSCRQPLPGSHDAFIAAHWKQTIGSMAHCLAGDATGIILSAIVVYHFGLPNGVDLIIEYLSAFVVGLMVFQALFMRDMYASYWTAVRKTFFSETVSMNMVMVGMIPTMMILMQVVPDGDNPWRGAFWGVMSAATLVGGLTAYPINSWLVAEGYKHGMMTAPSKAPEKQHHGHAHRGAMEGHAEMGDSHEGGHGHGAMPEPSPATVIAVSLGTFALMIAAAAVAASFVPLRF